jgi:secreted PhoX family phosphatase
VAASTHRRNRGLRLRLAVLSAAIVISLPVSAAGVTGYNTASASYVATTGNVAGVTFTPLVNSGETVYDVLFEGIPDGIGVVPGDGYVDLYVNHEQSKVPFMGFADFNDSSVTRVRVDVVSKSITEMEVALPSSAGFIRFCSSFMVGPDAGFGHHTLFTNEESNDPLNVPAGAVYPADPFYTPNAYRQAGYTVALDTVTGAIKAIAGMGRHNHENQVLIPGDWNKLAFLSGDDIFIAPGSQLYMYLANDSKQVLADKGHLWAFQVTKANGKQIDPNNPFNGANDYLDIAPGDTFAGRFIPVPDDIARGTTAGNPQDALETWSNDNNVFQFVRVEDIAYDPDHPRDVYFADTGTSRLAESETTGRLVRLGSGGTTSNGRIFKMVFNKINPRVVDSFQILADSANAASAFVNPDNVAISANSIMVTEDSSSANDVWQYSFGSGLWTKIASTTQVATAETSGIVDLSEWFGDGWWALDVQSHVNLPGFVTGLTYPGPGPSNGVTYTARREDGQLLLMYVPGS